MSSSSKIAFEWEEFKVLCGCRRFDWESLLLASRLQRVSMNTSISFASNVCRTRFSRVDLCFIDDFRPVFIFNTLRDELWSMRWRDHRRSIAHIRSRQKDTFLFSMHAWHTLLSSIFSLTKDLFENTFESCYLALFSVITFFCFLLRMRINRTGNSGFLWMIFFLILCWDTNPDSNPIHSGELKEEKIRTRVNLLCLLDFEQDAHNSSTSNTFSYAAFYSSRWFSFSLSYNFFGSTVVVFFFLMNSATVLGTNQTVAIIQIIESAVNCKLIVNVCVWRASKTPFADAFREHLSRCSSFQVLSYLLCAYAQHMSFGIALAAPSIYFSAGQIIIIFWLIRLS